MPHPRQSGSTVPCWLLALALSLVALRAQAEEPTALNRHTPAGQEVRVGNYGHWSANCNSGAVPKATVLRQPEHGRVDMREGLFKATHILIGNSQCEGTTLNGRLIYYIPDPGFKGTDRLLYEVRLTPQAFPLRFEVTIKVD